MSWLDGMVEDNEAESQNQRLGRTDEHLKPGFFTGALSTVGPNLLRGGIEAGAAIESGLSSAWQGGLDAAASLLLPEPKFGGTPNVTSAEEASQETLGEGVGQMAKEYRPDPAEVGVAGQIIGEAAAILPRTVVGAAFGGPVGAAVAAGGPAGYSRKRTAMEEGVDEPTATLLGLTEGVVTGVGAAIPAAGFTKSLIGDAVLAVGANVGLGMAHRGTAAALLDGGGYHAQAAQYRALDATAIATDAILGAAFFGIGRATLRRPTTDQIDAALADRNAQHADIDTAPGLPVDPRSAVAHQDALRSAIDSINRGEPVVLPDRIHSAEFLRTAEDSSVVAKAADKSDEAGLEINANENSFRYVIKDRSATDQSHLPGVEPHEIGRIVGNVTPDSIKITTSTISDGYSGKGVGTDAYAKLADQAHESGRSLVSDVEVTQAAARVYEKLADRGYKVTRNPEARLENVDGEAKWVSRSGPVFKVERPASKAAPSTAPRDVNERAAREEIDTLVRDHEATLPREPEAVPSSAPRAEQNPTSAKNASVRPEPKAEPAPVQAEPSAAGKAEGVAGAAELAQLRGAVARKPDAMILTGYDVDGKPTSARADEVLAAIEAEHAAGVREANAYTAAIGCLLRL